MKGVILESERVLAAPEEKLHAEGNLSYSYLWRASDETICHQITQVLHKAPRLRKRAHREFLGEETFSLQEVRIKSMLVAHAVRNYLKS